jgi:hypothetical protein
VINRRNKVRIQEEEEAELRRKEGRKPKERENRSHTSRKKTIFSFVINYLLQ